MDLCFYCFALLPAGAEVCDVCGAPTYVVTASGRLSNVRKLGGAIPSPANAPRALQVTPSSASLPPHVDLRANCSPVEDQGQLMSCCANATVGAFEHYFRARGRQIEISRLFVYYTGRRTAGRLPHDKGVCVSEAMGALVALGAPEEARWPYVLEQVNTEPPADVFNWAIANKPRAFASVTPGDGVRGALARGLPVVVNLSVGAPAYLEAAASGFLREPKPEELKPDGFAHAMLIVGYDLDRKEYTLRNSWGPTWGEQGYCRAAFSTVDTHGWPTEFWIIGDLDDLADRPVAPAATSGATPPSTVAGMAEKMRDEIRSSLRKDIEDSMKDIRERMKPKPPGQN